MGFIITYDITKGRINDLNFSFLQSTCNLHDKADDNIFYDSIVSYTDDKQDQVQLSFAINQTNPPSSNLWDETVDTFGFCIRTDLTGRSVGLNMTMARNEKIVKLKYSLVAGYSIITNELIDVAPNETLIDVSNNIGACLCNVDDECTSQALQMNQEFFICIYSEDDWANVEEVTSLLMKQRQVKYKPIQGGKGNDITEITLNKQFTFDGRTLNGASIRSRVFPIFFEDNAPSSITISGAVKLAFQDNKAYLRSLQQKIRENHVHDEIDTETFQLEVSLMKDDLALLRNNKEHHDKETNSLAVIAILTVGSISTLFVSAAVVRYLKK